MDNKACAGGEGSGRLTVGCGGLGKQALEHIRQELHRRSAGEENPPEAEANTQGTGEHIEGGT